MTCDVHSLFFFFFSFVFFMHYFLDHDHTDLDPAVLATLKKLQDGYFGGARSVNEDINKCHQQHKLKGKLSLLACEMLLGSRLASCQSF